MESEEKQLKPTRSTKKYKRDVQYTYISDENRQIVLGVYLTYLRTYNRDLFNISSQNSSKLIVCLLVMLEELLMVQTCNIPTDPGELLTWSYNFFIKKIGNYLNSLYRSFIYTNRIYISIVYIIFPYKCLLLFSSSKLEQCIPKEIL